MTDNRTGCPEKPLEPPENTEPPEWLEADDWHYQAFKDRRLENEFIRVNR